jgi:hypothetical protein
MEQQAVIRVVANANGSEVIDVNQERIDMTTVPSAAIWTDTHVTLTTSVNSGRKAAEQTAETEREVLIRVASLCPSEHKMTVQLQGDLVHQMADQACAGPLEPEDAVKWAPFVQMICEARQVILSDVRDGTGVESAWELAGRSTDEILEKAHAAEAVRVLGGDLVLLALQ